MDKEKCKDRVQISIAILRQPGLLSRSTVDVEKRAEYKIRNARRGATQCSVYRFLEIINCPR